MVTVVPGERRTSALRRALSSSAGLRPVLVGEIQWHRVDLDRYQVAVGGIVVGYIDVVGSVFVALRGPRYDRAIEIEQTLVFERALAVLRTPA